MAASSVAMEDEPEVARNVKTAIQILYEAIEHAKERGDHNRVDKLQRAAAVASQFNPTEQQELVHEMGPQIVRGLKRRYPDSPFETGKRAPSSTPQYAKIATIEDVQRWRSQTPIRAWAPEKIGQELQGLSWRTGTFFGLNPEPHPIYGPTANVYISRLGRVAEQPLSMIVQEEPGTEPRLLTDQDVLPHTWLSLSPETKRVWGQLPDADKKMYEASQRLEDMRKQRHQRDLGTIDARVLKDNVWPPRTRELYLLASGQTTQSVAASAGPAAGVAPMDES